MGSIVTVNRTKSFVDRTHNYLLQVIGEKAFFSRKHRHTFYELIYVLSGACTHTANDRRYEMTSGDMMLLSPMDMHCIISVAEGSVVLVVSFVEEELQKYELLYGSAALSAAKEGGVLSVPECIEPILQLIKREEDSYTDNQTRAICALLFSGVASATESKDLSMPKSFSQMLERMNFDLSLQREGLSGMLRISGYSTSQLGRLMKKYCNQTPHEYLKELRLRTARSFVTETDLSLEAIADECGYACYGYFTDIFKTRYGCSPAVLRRRLKNKT